MNYIKYLFLLLSMLALPAFSQIENETIEDNDESDVADSAMISPLLNDTIIRPWPQNVQHKLTNLLESDLLKTSQLGLMVYDLDADSTIFATSKYNEAHHRYHCNRPIRWRLSVQNRALLHWKD